MFSVQCCCEAHECVHVEIRDFSYSCEHGGWVGWTCGWQMYQCGKPGWTPEREEWWLTAPPKQGGTPGNNIKIKWIMISKYVWPLETQSGTKQEKRKQALQSAWISLNRTWLNKWMMTGIRRDRRTGVYKPFVMLCCGGFKNVALCRQGDSSRSQSRWEIGRSPKWQI